MGILNPLAAAMSLGIEISVYRQSHPIDQANVNGQKMMKEK